MNAVTILQGAQYSRETLAAVRAAGIEALLVEHYHEIAHYPDIEFDPDWETYAKLEEAGRLHIFTARVAGELVGYSVHIVAPNLHYKRSLQAVQDILFVHPAHRRGFVGYKLIRFADSELEAFGVQVSYHHSKATHPALGRLLERQGYELIDFLHGRRLDRT